MVWGRKPGYKVRELHHRGDQWSADGRLGTRLGVGCIIEVTSGLGRTPGYKARGGLHCRGDQWSGDRSSQVGTLLVVQLYA